jgi:hypothetical protein
MSDVSELSAEERECPACGADARFCCLYQYEPAARLADRDARLAAVEALAPLARRIVEQTDTTCTCPDEPHQNALHDLAHDLVAALHPDPTELEREPELPTERAPDLDPTQEETHP